VAGVEWTMTPAESLVAPSGRGEQWLDYLVVLDVVRCGASRWALSRSPYLGGWEWKGPSRLSKVEALKGQAGEVETRARVFESKKALARLVCRQGTCIGRMDGVVTGRLTDAEREAGSS